MLSKKDLTRSHVRSVDYFGNGKVLPKTVAHCRSIQNFFFLIGRLCDFFVFYMHHERYNSDVFFFQAAFVSNVSAGWMLGSCSSDLCVLKIQICAACGMERLVWGGPLAIIFASAKLFQEKKKVFLCTRWVFLVGAAST